MASSGRPTPFLSPAPPKVSTFASRLTGSSVSLTFCSVRPSVFVIGAVTQELLRPPDLWNPRIAGAAEELGPLEALAFKIRRLSLPL